MRTLIACLALLPALAGAQEMRLPPETARLNRMAARFAPVDIRVDIAGLPEGERLALAHLIRAARMTDVLYMRQMWAGNPAMLLRLMEDGTPLGRVRALRMSGDRIGVSTSRSPPSLAPPRRAACRSAGNPPNECATTTGFFAAR